MKHTRKQREAARAEAKRRISEIDAFEVKINDAICSHVTVIKRDVVRVDWWPGARLWRVGEDDFEGGFDEFAAWVKA